MSALDAWFGLALPLVALALLLLAPGRTDGAPHARVTREGGTVFLGERLMQRGYAWIDRLAGMIASAGLSANTVSWLSLALGLLAGVLVARGWLGAAAWSLALSGLCDGLDGAIARRQGAATKAGAVLDSVLDRYVEFFYLAGIVWLFRGFGGAQLLALLALFGGFMVTYSTAKAEALHVTPPRGWMKRPERIVWLLVGSALAAAAPLVHLPPGRVLLVTIGVIAVFANLSAIIRLRALAASVR